MEPSRPSRPLTQVHVPCVQDYDEAGNEAALGGAFDLACIGLWMAGSLAGIVTAALISQSPVFHSLARRLGLGGSRSPRDSGSASSREPRPPSAEEALPMLAHAVVGNSKSAVARVFGPPISAVVPIQYKDLSPSTFWAADTWYYPLPRNGRMAMAILFAEDYAERVEFVRAPRV